MNVEDVVGVAAPTGCPFHARRSLQGEGTPLTPSFTLKRVREEAVATPLDFVDGHRGLIGTGYGFGRAALEGVEIEAIHIPQGTTVSVSSVAANHDPARWDSPHEIDIRRGAFGHVGFGHGIHGCVGQQIARVEIREAITQLIGGMPELRLVRAEQLGPIPFTTQVR